MAATVAQKAARRLAGLCWMCGKTSPEVGRAVCRICRGRRNLYIKKYRQTPRGKERNDFWVRQWIKQNPERRRDQRNRYYQKLKTDVFARYGKKCQCCGESNTAFLTIDHIDGMGRRHEASISTTLYVWLKKNNFPSGFQTLCWNCNLAKHIYGRCPHQKGDNNVRGQ